MASVDVTELARKLLAGETGGHAPADAGPALRVCERLRVPLSKLAGTAGFATLLSRALALAKAQAPSLSPLRVREDGSIQPTDQPSPQNPGTPGSPANLALPDTDAAVVLIAQLLGLLITFIGEPLTLRLVNDVWPDLSTDAKNSQEEGAP